jgi:hypothetical protein
MQDREANTTYAVKFFLQILIGIAQLVSSGSNATQCFSMNSSSLMENDM